MNNYKEKLISFKKSNSVKKLSFVFTGNTSPLLTPLFSFLLIFYKGVKSFIHYPHSYLNHNIFIYKN